MEVVVIMAFAVLIWLFWQYVNARRFRRFVNKLNGDIAVQTRQVLLQELQENQSELTPNNEIHQQASLFYWQQYPVRILQLALAQEVLTEQALKANGEWRFCQHLFHIQGQFLNLQLQNATEQK